MYRQAQPLCLVCDEPRTVERCLRCSGAVCVAHTPTSDARCEVCEADWIAAARPLRTIRRGPLVALIGHAAPEPGWIHRLEAHRRLFREGNELVHAGVPAAAQIVEAARPLRRIHKDRPGRLYTDYVTHRDRRALSARFS